MGLAVCAILMSVRCCLLVVFICISLIGSVHQRFSVSIAFGKLSLHICCPLTDPVVYCQLV